MNREQWERECAQQFIDVGGLETGEAAAFARACANEQATEDGPDPANWVSPAEAAEIDMSYWGD